MALLYETNFTGLQPSTTTTEWISDAEAQNIRDYGRSGELFGFGFQTGGVAFTPSAIFSNQSIIPSSGGATIEFKMRIYETIGGSSEIACGVYSRDGWITIVLSDRIGGGLYFNDNTGTLQNILPVDKIDYSNGHVLKLIIKNDDTCDIYCDGIYYFTRGFCGSPFPVASDFYINSIDGGEFHYLRVYDQSIFPPDELPPASVSNGTLYFTNEEVRNAGRFRNNEILVVESGSAAYIHASNMEYVHKLTKVNKTTGLITTLVRVDSSPATGQYSFSKPNVFVFGDVPSSNEVYYAEIERMIYSNEINDVREEVQAEIDGILSPKFSKVPLPSNRIFTQVRKMGAEMAALKIMMRHEQMMGKNMPGLVERYNFITQSLKDTETFTLNGAIYTTDNPRTIKIGYWQTGHFATKETRRNEWGRNR